MIESAALAVLNRLDPERAHGLALRALHTPFAPVPGPVQSPHLKVNLAGLDLPNPVGLAAGFDKNATAVGPLMQAGFGFLEVGAATPRPQPGNPKPRLFRLRTDKAAINRFVEEHNSEPKPFVWTADPDRILGKVTRGTQALASVH